MGTSLSFHNRYLYGTNRLVVTTLIVIFSLLKFQQISCTVIPETSMMGESVDRIRHLTSKKSSYVFSNIDIVGLENSGADSRTSSRNANNSQHAGNGYFSRIKSLCSNKYVSIYNDNISAIEISPDDSTVLQFEKIPGRDNKFHIKRKLAEKYVCYSRRGKLFIRSDPRASNDRCVFTKHIPTESSELSDNPYIKIQSVANPAWFIGFNKRGLPFKGWHHGIKRDKCFRFQEKQSLETANPASQHQSDSRSSSERRRRRNINYNSQSNFLLET